MYVIDFRREHFAFLGLTTVKGIGFWTLHKISQSGGSFHEALKQPEKYKIDKYLNVLKGDAQDIEEVKIKVWNEGKRLSKQLAEKGIVLIFQSENSFPSRLRGIPDAPWWIFVEGTVDVLNRPSCTIVGTRKVSEDGIFLTRLLTTSLKGMGLVTVSGLAQGIDQTAHRESIRYDIPTIAVLGTGVLNNYPVGSESLRDSIVKNGGAVVTEYIPNQSYSAENFVRRNRLQAALGDVLFPCEWAIKSGTAHTVKYASNYNKKIINIYLPLTLNFRPEIDFSIREYSALAIELPKDLDRLHDELRKNEDTEASLRDVETDELRKNEDTEASLRDVETDELRKNEDTEASLRDVETDELRQKEDTEASLRDVETDELRKNEDTEASLRDVETDELRQKEDTEASLRDVETDESSSNVDTNSINKDEQFNLDL